MMSGTLVTEYTFIGLLASMISTSCRLEISKIGTNSVTAIQAPITSQLFFFTNAITDNGTPIRANT